MTAESTMRQNRPTIRVRLTRDSVCAGDDCECHDRQIEMPTFTDAGQFAKHAAAGYLPSVAGVGHSWTCVLNGERIAVLTVSNVRPLIAALTLNHDNTVHFIYHAATY